MMNLTGTSLPNSANSLFDTETFSSRRQRAALTVQVIRHGPPQARVSIMGRVERPTTSRRKALKLPSALPDQRVCSTQAVLMSLCFMGWRVSHTCLL